MIVIKIPICDSTNKELLKAIALDNVPSGTVYWTDRQTAGRGRLNRSWESPEGNIALSVATKLPDDRATSYQLNLVAALSVSQTLQRWCSAQVQIKWPNDVLLEGQKCCGVLGEIASLDLAVIGIGINMNCWKRDFSIELQHQLTTVREKTKHFIEPERFLTDLLTQLELNFELFRQQGLSAFRQRIYGQLAFRDQPITVRDNTGSCYNARILGLTDEGFLIVVTESGVIRTLQAEDVQVRGG